MIVRYSFWSETRRPSQDLHLDHGDDEDGGERRGSEDEGWISWLRGQG